MAKRERREEPIGTGWYKYQNITGADLLLPRPLINGRMMVGVNGTFEADSYYQGTPGLHIIENLCHYLKPKEAPPGHLLNSGTVRKPEPPPETVAEEVKPTEQAQAQLITDVASPGTLEFFEADGTPLNEEKSNREKGAVDLTKKELLNFAELKGLKVNPNWTKEKILECIRK